MTTEVPPRPEPRPERPTASPTTSPSGTAGKQHTDPDPDRPPICGESVILPLGLALTARRYADRWEIEPTEIQNVRCTLQAHMSGKHYAFVMDITATTSAWTRWDQDAGPEVVLVLPDCRGTEPDQGTPCSEYEGHPDGHTWQVDDPWNSVEPAL